MVEIAKAESNLNAHAYNPEWHRDRKGNKICQGSIGLFQVGCVNHIHNPQELYDIQVNLKVARRIYDTQGLKAWGVCRKIVDCGL